MAYLFHCCWITSLVDSQLFLRNPCGDITLISSTLSCVMWDSQGTKNVKLASICYWYNSEMVLTVASMQQHLNEH